MSFENDSFFRTQFIECPNKIRAQIDANCKAPKRIVDFGCGKGAKTIALARAYPHAEVLGVDITQAFDRAQGLADKYFEGELPDNLSFRQIKSGQSLSRITSPDVIYSWSVLEHIDRHVLSGILQDMAQSLSPDGVVVTQVAPLYYSPFGSHLRKFDETPWQHLLMSDYDYRRAITSQSDADGPGSPIWMFARYEELNKITAPELFDSFKKAGFAPLLEDIKQVQIDPPEFLLQAFCEKALRTNELFSVHKVPAQHRVGKTSKSWLGRLKRGKDMP